jgi:hypothetical protein
MFRFLVLSLLSLNAIAAPQTIEVWYLSNSKITQINKLLDRSAYVYYPKTAELECQEMGEYCFDPQVGLYKKDDAESQIATEKIETSGPSIPAKGAIERDLIDCDKGNYFDIYCGKARKEAESQKTKLDLWIDTSSSIREFDFEDKDGGCYRKQLASRLDTSCGFNKEVNVMMFDTSIKQAGTMDSLCQNQGLNDYKKLIDWIERSDAKKLVVITDIYELHKEFNDYIVSKHGTVRGDKEALTAEKLLGLVDHLAKLCE